METSANHLSTIAASPIPDKVFKSGLSKFCERQLLKNLKGYGLLKIKREIKRWSA